MWTRRAESGRVGRSSSASCVEYMIAPLGFAMAIGRVVGRLLMTAADTVQKCAVLPLSAMAMVESGGMTVGGGPTGKLVEDKLKPESLRTLGGRKVKSKVVGGVGSPRRQLDASEAVV